MGAIQRVVQQVFRYGQYELSGQSATETGDTEIIVEETVAAGATKVFPLGVIAANLKGMVARVTPPTASVTTDQSDELLASGGDGAMTFSQSLGHSNPMPTGDSTTITVDNSAGGADVDVFVAAISETP